MYFLFWIMVFFLVVAFQKDPKSWTRYQNLLWIWDASRMLLRVKLGSISLQCLVLAKFQFFVQVGEQSLEWEWNLATLKTSFHKLLYKATHWSRNLAFKKTNFFALSYGILVHTYFRKHSIKNKQTKIRHLVLYLYSYSFRMCCLCNPNNVFGYSPVIYSGTSCKVFAC